MSEEASFRKAERVSVKLLSQRYLSTMNATWIGVTLPLPNESGFLGFDCFTIVVYFVLTQSTTKKKMKMKRGEEI